MKKTSFYVLLALTFTILGMLLPQTGAIHMTTKKAFTTDEPLLIEGEKQNSYSVLPVGTVLYLDKSWPEGHDTYHVYFHFKGDLRATPADSNVIAPLWLRTVDRNEITKLTSEYPASKEDLISILKARQVTKQELAQILRDWPD